MSHAPEEEVLLQCIPGHCMISGSCVVNELVVLHAHCAKQKILHKILQDFGTKSYLILPILTRSCHNLKG